MIEERYFTLKKIIPIEEPVSFFLVFNNGECLNWDKWWVPKMRQIIQQSIKT